MRIENDIKLGFKDVMIRPKRSTLQSRAEVSLLRNFKFRHSGKTWEGVAGAQVATLVYAVACVVISPSLQTMVQGGNWAPFLGVASLLCAISIVGDLFESLIKRQAMVKDSGTLLPGHGGVLDRIDSITSTVPVAALLFYVLAGGA